MAQKSITSFFKPDFSSRASGGGDGGGGAFFSGKKRERDRDDDAPDIPDPFRFRELHIQQQKHDFEFALSEIEAGHKRDHWIWWVIPTPPNVEGGVEVASATNRKYALRDAPGALQGDAAARAYLQFPAVDGIHLRSNYLRIMKAALKKLQNGADSVYLMGSKVDQCKLRASAELFERVSRPSKENEGKAAGEEEIDGANGGEGIKGDEEVNTVCRQILAALDAEEAATSEPKGKTAPEERVQEEESNSASMEPRAEEPSSQDLVSSQSESTPPRAEEQARERRRAWRKRREAEEERWKKDDEGRGECLRDGAEGAKLEDEVTGMDVRDKTSGGGRSKMDPVS